MKKYEMIAKEITYKIYTNEYKDKLPSQIELANLFKTSRVTIQRALSLLEYSGTIKSIKGSGIYVNEIINILDEKVDEFFGSTKKYEGLGKITSKVVSFEIRNAEEIEIKNLKLSKNDKVYDIIRVRYLNNVPIVIEYTIMPLDVIPNITEEILHSSIYSYIKDTLKLKTGRSIRKIKADKSDYYDQLYLNAKADDPILEIENIVYLSNNVPFEYSQTRRRYDRGIAYIITNKNEMDS